MAVWSAERLRAALNKSPPELVRSLRRRLRARPDRFLPHCRGIVHVGANEGQERALYDRYGLTVVWIEALPSVYEKLTENIRPYPRQTAIKALLSDRAGQIIRFRIANNDGQSSSMFDLALHRDIWPEVDYVGSVEMETSTLDEILAGNNVDERLIDGLVLDTQGSELLVLQGARRLLPRIRYAKVEAADFEAYQGGATVASLRGYLSNFSLFVVRQQAFARHPGGGTYYDLVFKRSRPRKAITDLHRMFKRASRRLLGDTMAGAVDYYRKPQLKASWGGPFNGQPARCELFKAIVAKIGPRALVETGTHFGTTTEFMATTGLPVFTVEADPRRFGYARARFRNRRNVTVLRGDSRVGLQSLFAGSLQQFGAEALFFYLDAHWNDDLPLAEELDLVFSRCFPAAVMIDDFQVPFDAGYGYDDYGPGKTLAADYIAPAVSAHGLRAFYPATPSAEEGGGRRGCIVLAKHPAVVSSLSSLPLLRRDDDLGAEPCRSPLGDRAP
jgi:FkbM family methyltransferase